MPIVINNGIMSPKLDKSMKRVIRITRRGETFDYY